MLFVHKYAIVMIYDLLHAMLFVHRYTIVMIYDLLHAMLFVHKYAIVMIFCLLHAMFFVHRYTIVMIYDLLHAVLFVHRYTIVMIYYAFSLVLMMLFRPFISYKFVDGRGNKSIYAALYFLPVLIITQAVFGGLICEYTKHHPSWGNVGMVVFRVTLPNTGQLCDRSGKKSNFIIL